MPPSIREAALGMGASKMQMVAHHVLPLAMPGMLTGTIIGMARALGETAPLLMIGMVAFIVDIPRGVTDPATALPVQIYLWADSPERGFVETHLGRHHRAPGVPGGDERGARSSCANVSSVGGRSMESAVQVERAGINLQAERAAFRTDSTLQMPVEMRARPVGDITVDDP